MMNYYYYPNHMFFGGLGFLSFLWDILVVWLIIVLVRKIFFNTKLTSEKNRPLEILKRRYAKGKITKKQFEDMKKEMV